MAVSKDEIKLILDNLSELKDDMVYPDDWRDFKAEMSKLIVEYSKNPILDNRKKINELIERNFLDKSFGATQAINTVISELGISEKSTSKENKQSNSKNSSSKSSNRELEEFYKSIGLKYEFSEEEINQRYEELFGKVKDKKEKKSKNETKSTEEKKKDVVKSYKKIAEEKVQKLAKEKIIGTIKRGARAAGKILDAAGDFLYQSLDPEQDKDNEKQKEDDLDIEKDNDEEIRE